MTSEEAWLVASSLMQHLRSAWIWAHPLSKPYMPQRLRDVARGVRRELKPFYIPSVFAGIVFDFVADARTPWWQIAVTLGCYWVMNKFGGGDDDDDDRWRRRRERAAGAIRELGGKLVVVPQPQAS